MARCMSNPVREHPPCYGCTREEKRPGCHDRCKDYKAWKDLVQEVQGKRNAYLRRKMSRIY